MEGAGREVNEKVVCLIWIYAEPHKDNKPTAILQTKPDHPTTSMCLAFLFCKSEKLNKRLIHLFVWWDNICNARIWIHFWWFVSAIRGFQISGHIYFLNNGKNYRNRVVLVDLGEITLAWFTNLIPDYPKSGIVSVIWCNRSVACFLMQLPVYSTDGGVLSVHLLLSSLPCRRNFYDLKKNPTCCSPNHGHRPCD